MCHNLADKVIVVVSEGCMEVYLLCDKEGGGSLYLATLLRYIGFVFGIDLISVWRHLIWRWRSPGFLLATVTLEKKLLFWKESIESSLWVKAVERSLPPSSAPLLMLLCLCSRVIFHLQEMNHDVYIIMIGTLNPHLRQLKTQKRKKKTLMLVMLVTKPLKLLLEGLELKLKRNQKLWTLFGTVITNKFTS